MAEGEGKGFLLAGDCLGCHLGEGLVVCTRGFGPVFSAEIPLKFSEEIKSCLGIVATNWKNGSPLKI